MKNKLKFSLTLILAISLSVILPLSLTACKAEDDGRYVEETTDYYINKLNVFGLPIGLFIDGDESYFELRPDGTMSIQVIFGEGASDMLLGIQDLANLDLSTFNVQGIVEQYAASLMPGFTLDDVEFSLGLLDDIVGMSFVGFDMEDEGVKELVDALETTGKLPYHITIPDYFGVQYEGKYYIDEVTSELTGESYKTVYTGDCAPNGEPFIMMSIYDNDDGTERIYLRIEFLTLEMYGTTQA